MKRFVNLFILLIIVSFCCQLCSAATMGIKFIDSSDADMQKIRDLIAVSVRIEPVFRRSAKDLNSERKRILSRYNQTADLTLCYYITVSDEDSDAVKETLTRNPDIEFVYNLSERMVPAAFDEETPDFRANQEYLDDPAGPNLARAWGYDFGTGAGIRVVDIEMNCNRNHEDLIQKLGDESVVIGGTPCGSTDHGTAVAGMLIASNDTKGITGICYDAGMSLFFASDIIDLPDAINNVQSVISAGDIILIELQIAGPNWPGGSSQFGLVPVEWDSMTRLAIANAIALGRIIIQPAGNGSQNLDDPVYADVFGSDATDTGSIIVGAGKPADRSATNYTNYGMRLNLQGWSERMSPCCQVWSTGYGNAPGSPQAANQLYTDRFSGTSSAAAMVTGAAVCLQSAGKYRQNAVLSPKILRSALVDTGYSQTGAKNIGFLPNISAAIESIPLKDVTVDLRINQDQFEAGDMFILSNVTNNPRSQVAAVRYLALQCLDEWFFMNCDLEIFPYFTGCPVILSSGDTEDIFYEFIWPEGDFGSVFPEDGYAFYLAYLDWEMELMGNLDYVDFGWH